MNANQFDWFFELDNFTVTDQHWIKMMQIVMEQREGWGASK